MIRKWLAERRREAILEDPFPEAHRKILDDNVAHVAYLDDDERAELERMVQVFAIEKQWEGCGGQTIDDEVRVTISGLACLLILAHEHALYRNVASILVYPSAVVSPEHPQSVFGTAIEPVRAGVPLLGQVHKGGPVILAWNAVRRGAYNPTDGRNVVYHEFAHKLDLLDGAADGTPPLDTDDYETWVEACSKVYLELVDNAKRGKKSFLDDYGATNEAEFFAVATEFFFEKPTRMKREHPALYDVFQAFYQQDTAAREARHREATRDDR